jgi:hypothetical protein
VLAWPHEVRMIGGRAAAVKGERKTPWVRWALHRRLKRDHEGRKGEIQPHVIA